jgi:hypothetical protein
MKKKQKADILGEEQTDLPINEGMGGIRGKAEWILTFLQFLEDVRTRSAIRSGHISTSCRREVRMSRPRLSTRSVTLAGCGDDLIRAYSVSSARSNGENTETS